MTLRLAIVGCGLMTEQTHLPAAKRANGVSIDALVDSDLHRAEDLAARFGVGVAAATIEEVAQVVDAILLVTPPHVRAPIIRDAVSNGLHVLCEKPLANSAEECAELQRLTGGTGTGIVTACAHVYRFWPARAWVRDAMQSNRLGRPVAVHASQGAPYSWKSASGYSVRKEMVPGGVLINAGIHPLDTLLWWFGNASIDTYRDDAMGGLESNVSLQLVFASGVKGELVMSRTHRLQNAIRVTTERCVIELPTYSRNRLKLIEHGTERWIELDDVGQDHLGPSIAQLEDFAEAVALHREPRVDFAEASRVVKLVDECYRMKRLRPLPAQAPIPGEVW